MTAYVDDLNAHHTFESVTSDKVIYHRMIETTEKWSKVLYFSGVKLSTTKCRSNVKSSNIEANFKAIENARQLYGIKEIIIFCRTEVIYR
jgi:hypothetical protein